MYEGFSLLFVWLYLHLWVVDVKSWQIEHGKVRVILHLGVKTVAMSLLWMKLEKLWCKDLNFGAIWGLAKVGWWCILWLFVLSSNRCLLLIKKKKKGNRCLFSMMLSRANGVIGSLILMGFSWNGETGWFSILLSEMHVHLYACMLNYIIPLYPIIMQNIKMIGE